jgi:hypothetical protein
VAEGSAGWATAASTAANGASGCAGAGALHEAPGLLFCGEATARGAGAEPGNAGASARMAVALLRAAAGRVALVAPVEPPDAREAHDIAKLIRRVAEVVQ